MKPRKKLKNLGVKLGSILKKNNLTLLNSPKLLHLTELNIIKKKVNGKSQLPTPHKIYAYI
jgi:hypothetical protein